MKTHTTTTLKTLITVQMKADNVMTDMEIEGWITILPEISEELKANIHFFTHSIFNVGLIKKQLRQMHKESANLLDTVEKYVPLREEMQILKKMIIDCLVVTLNCLLNQNKRYVDLTLVMSQRHYQDGINLRKEQQAKIRSLITSHCIKPDLNKILLEPYNKMISYKADSYNALNYTNNFYDSVYKILTSYTAETVVGRIKNYLYESNFNSELFIKYYLDQYQIKLDLITDLHDRKKYLIRAQDELKEQKATEKYPKYEKDNWFVFDRLARFMDTELRCLTVSIKKATPVVVPLKAPVPAPYCPPDYKLRFNFSVESLAYLIKLLVNVNVIEPGIKAELLRYVAANFQTPGTKLGGIAAGSFQTKYKNVTQSTSVTVRAALMAMLKLVDKEF